MPTDERLVALLAEKSVLFGEFTLASGRRSDFYIDARLSTMSPEGLRLIGEAGRGALERAGWNVDSVGGLTMGADPIAYASAESAKPLRAFAVRKEAKLHGTGKRVEGPFREGDVVAVIEDVVTSGSSALSAIDAVRQEGGTVAGVLALLDREEGGTERIEARGVRVIALTRASDVLRAARRR
ncbi:MAG: orotate phosphoribosyltransferase [Gemmatimonadaceae bacterium]|nr:orotate phosphoribosyltransferase [Gemmatimonadaceae bacterium]